MRVLVTDLDNGDKVVEISEELYLKLKAIQGDDYIARHFYGRSYHLAANDEIGQLLDALDNPVENKLPTLVWYW